MNTDISSQTIPPNSGIRKPVFLYVFGIVLAIFFFVFSLMVIIYSPRDTGDLMRHAGVFFAELPVVGLFLFSLFGVYALFYFYGREYLRERSSFRVVIYFTAVFAIILILTPPFFSSDLYGYTSRASIANIHNVNPYFVTPAELGYSDVVAWADREMVYGPLFTTISLGLNKLVGQNVVVNLLAFRLLMIGFLAASAFLIYKILSKIAPKFQYFGTALFLWNPFVLIESVHSAHNDVFMMFFILLSIYLILLRKFVWAAGALTLGFLVKFSTVILLPIVFLFIINQPSTIKRKIRDIILAGLLIVVLIAVFYLPYQNFSENIGNLGRAFITDNNLTFPQAIIYTSLSLVDRFSNFELDLSSLRAGYLFIFLVLYFIVLFYRDLTKEYNFISSYFWILLIFLFLLGGKFNIWYILWFLPLVLLVRNSKYHSLILFITVYGFLYYATLSVFIPNVLFCVSLVIYYAVVKWNTQSIKKQINHQLSN